MCINSQGDCPCFGTMGALHVNNTLPCPRIPAAALIIEPFMVFFVNGENAREKREDSLL
jgi:hypothetical protein